ncbi:hypothetical protein CcaverHIS002_0510970 [Cutaneotrichosporon cavernicola]|uniref:DUF4240 domain-containing protein n=1 Tax=Cutaneotrichosporon cavernicola TaxID=279322 RepID=A0AA48QXG0_9TREE|nr:uncharacterized protein CcaverHIS019_0511520 [Cutaneotrichosporon cavernicola]BEI85696.1 hypothetical protein CcaverHIS002_0510970 [Cutaneotrichosporon cavernicola]BEI93524.1 hypothetical protein CcaverHIS019_0511520 [Cutaneotrichosporon cavernicola]BEJ01303.1 hypothetical protein CcaverHIS631_0511600 [Cutaneotrichosporon cavernicola]BEJ09070.1 hypothetical protein CcaverHIS641_0511640 [Cutaneotrichosporon cavernicola]
MTIPSLPTRDDFWGTIERAWSTIDDSSARALLLSENAEERLAAAETLVNKHTEAMLEALRIILRQYNAPQLAAWDAHCERALYDLDREDVHEALDGSDDGFLYTRGFVVAAGRKHYEAVFTQPLKWGIMDVEEESMCYLACHLYKDMFGEWPPRTGISRETCSNKDGWP